MGENRYKLALEKFPAILKIYDNVAVAFETIFGQLNSVCPLEYAILYYINSEKLNIKYKYNCSFEYPYNIPFSDECKQQIYESEVLKFNFKSFLSDNLQLPETQNSNYVILKLSVNDAIFGFIVFAKSNDVFSDEEINILKAFTAIASYAIKDNELSEVLKMQFKVLHDDILIKTETCKLIEAENKKILETDNLKNEYIAKLSHELRTPMNSIIGFAELLKNTGMGELNPKQLNCVNDIHASSIQLLGMINEVLDIAKLDANMMKLIVEDVNIDYLLSETVNIIKPLADKKKLTISIDNSVDTLYKGDYRKLQQILFNLLSNAIKFTYDNGKIEVKADETDTTLILRIKDNGIGIDPKYHGKIFGKFVQLENNSFSKESSTGLGLTITKELVRLHNGSIKLESKLNEGTVFIVELPKNIF